ncbi:unnamed protein product [Cunninghamella blakesleeana]
MRAQTQGKRSSLVSQQAVKQWKDLTPAQKVSVATKTSFNFTLVGVGLVMTVGLAYVVGSELFGSQSSTNIFSDAVDKVRQNEELIQLLGTPIKGHGAPSRNRMKRNRRIQYQIMDDQYGKPHLFMKFYVEGPQEEGVGMIEMIKDEKDKWQYKHLYVDVPAYANGLPVKRVYIERN